MSSAFYVVITRLLPVPIKFVFHIFLLAHYISAFRYVKDKTFRNQKEMTIVDLHFVKSVA